MRNKRSLFYIAKKAGKKLLQLLPINPRIIMFYVHDRKGLCCNPKYILLELLKGNENAYKLYWVTDYPKTVPKSRHYKVLKKRSLQYYSTFTRAKFFITNDMLDELLIKKKGQIVINTWHGGGAFKKAGFDLWDAEERREIIDLWYGRTDYMIVSNQYLVPVFMRAFHLEESQMLKFGLPRCDLFFRPNLCYEGIRKKYGFDSDVKILLYAPTYRYGDYELLKWKEVLAVLDALQVRFGGRWVCLFRAHQFDKENHMAGCDGRIVDCMEHYDVQEILCAADFMVSDYSSLLWEFSLLRRPSASYAKSPRRYAEQERDFYIPYDEWPYLKAETVEMLKEQIMRFDEAAYQTAVEDFNRRLGGFEDGESSKRVAELIKNI